MKRLDFKYLAAKRFLCFGEQGIELDLKSYGNVVVVTGTNFDDLHQATQEPGSNGTGKSTIQDILVYALFGKPAKRKLHHKDVIHKGSSGNAYTEVRWDNCRVVRTCKKNTLQLWESNDGIWDETTEISRGAGMGETQKEINKRLGLNYRTFMNIVVFDDNNESSFLESEAEEKRSIVENLLSLDKYRDFSKRAKDALKELDRDIKGKLAIYDRCLAEKDSCDFRLRKISEQDKQWKAERLEELNRIKSAIEKKRLLMKSTDNGSALQEYEQAQEKLSQIEKEIPVLEAKESKVRELISQARAEKETLEETRRETSLDISSIKADLQEIRKDQERKKSDNQRMNAMEPGTKCENCLSNIESKNYKHLIQRNENILVEHARKITAMTADLESKTKLVVNLQGKCAQYEASIDMAGKKLAEFVSKIDAARSEFSRLSKIGKPEIDADTRILEDQIAELKNQAIAKHAEANGKSPFVVIYDAAKEELEAKTIECETKKQEIETQERLVPYYKYWVKAFGDDGIRKYVIDGIIPALNSQIAYWLEVLIYGNISLRFDPSFEETIERVPHTGDPFVYYALSGGERRRVNLALLQAFAHVMVLNSGTSPSLVFLDEVAINIDKNGVEGVFNMIWELSQDKQVFITTHDSNLLELLKDCSDNVCLERKKGVTKLVSKAPVAKKAA